jgi:cytochrome c oxidase subunit 1
MFATGLGPVSVAVFSIATMAIAIPTGVKIFNWLLTMWGGKIWYTTAMKFAIGLVLLFTVGGLSGVTHSVAPSDTQQTDTYYIVAHFHYVLFGGMVFGLFAGFYYWWPKVFGRMLNEKMGSWNFWLMFFGMNLTFGPMHILGLQGQPRRMYIWTEARAGEGFFNLAFWNLVASIGSFILTAGVLMFLINVAYTWRKGPKAAADPWDARTLEWLTTNPPKPHNFDRIPVVHHLDEFFHRKYEEDTATHTMRRVADGEDLVRAEEAAADSDIHLPGPSYWPLVLALGIGVLGLGTIYGIPVMVVGAAAILLGSFGWVLEPSVPADSEIDPPSVDGPTKEIAPLG